MCVCVCVCVAEETHPRRHVKTKVTLHNCDYIQLAYPTGRFALPLRMCTGRGELVWMSCASSLLCSILDKSQTHTAELHLTRYIRKSAPCTLRTSAEC